MTVSDVVGVACLVCCIAAVWLGRRKGKARLNAALAAARAEGHAEALSAAHAAVAVHNHVVAGNDQRRSTGIDYDHHGAEFLDDNDADGARDFRSAVIAARLHGLESVRGSDERQRLGAVPISARHVEVPRGADGDALYRQRTAPGSGPGVGVPVRPAS